MIQEAFLPEGSLGSYPALDLRVQNWRIGNGRFKISSIGASRRPMAKRGGKASIRFRIGLGPEDGVGHGGRRRPSRSVQVVTDCLLVLRIDYRCVRRRPARDKGLHLANGRYAGAIDVSIGTVYGFSAVEQHLVDVDDTCSLRNLWPLFQGSEQIVIARYSATPVDAEEYFQSGK